MTFEGILLNQEFNKGRKSGNIEISNGSIIFNDQEAYVFKMSLMNIEVTHGGAGNRYVFFNNKNNPGFTLYTDEKNILNHPDLKYISSAEKSRKTIKNNRRLLWFSVTGIATLFILGILSIFIFRNTIVEKIAQSISPKVEQSITEQLKKSILVDKKVISNPFIDSQLQLLVEPLVNAVENKDFKFNFSIIKDPTLNAFALPGGTIIIHSGLIEKSENQNEVLGVLAHEISHVTRRHHLRGIINNLGLLTIARGFLGDVAGISTDLITVGVSLESLKYSRNYEREADKSGYELMIRAQKDPQGMISFFEKLEKEHSGLEMADFLSTHPDTKERILNLKQQYLKEKYIVIYKNSINFDLFKSTIKTLSNQ